MKFVEEIKEEENESKNGRDSCLVDESKHIENSTIDIRVEELKSQKKEESPPSFEG